MESTNNQTFEQSFELFLVSRKANGVRSKTIESYESQFRAISNHINVHQILKYIDKMDIQNMIVSMRESNLRNTSIQTYTRCLRTFFNWACSEGYSNLKIKLYRAEETIKEPYSDDELLRLLKEPNAECEFWEIRDWTIINFLLNSGCRAATLRSIQIGDIDFQNGLISFRHNKNGKIQVMPLCSNMKNVLVKYLNMRGGSKNDLLFCNNSYKPLTENALRKTIIKYNHSRLVNKTSIHLFRHTFAKKFLLDCGGDAFTLQHLLGHKTLAMTRHYCNIYNADIVHRFETICPLARMNQS